MTTYLTRGAAGSALYSTGQQWAQIVGTVPAGSTLAGRDSWLAGATSLTGAQAACRRPPLVAGRRVYARASTCRAAWTATILRLTGLDARP